MARRQAADAENMADGDILYRNPNDNPKPGFILCSQKKRGNSQSETL